MTKKQPPLEAGTYRAQVVSIDERFGKPAPKRTGITRTLVAWQPRPDRKYTRRPKADSGFKPKLIWTFNVSHGDGGTTVLTGRSSQESEGDAKLLRWGGAITGRPISPGESFDTDDWIGCRCNVTVDTKPGVSFVDDVLRRDWEVV
jgi:hypothetical protein